MASELEIWHKRIIQNRKFTIYNLRPINNNTCNSESNNGKNDKM